MPRVFGCFLSLWSVDEVYVHFSRFQSSLQVRQVLGGEGDEGGLQGGDSIEKFQLQFCLEKSLEFWLEMPYHKEKFLSG